MKKVIAIVLAIAMVLSLAACGAKEAVQNSINEIKDAVEDVKEGNINQEPADATAPEGSAAVGMANPWVETDAAGVMDKTGFDFVVPKGAKDVKYSVLESQQMAQMTFTLDGEEYTARMKDIGGTKMEDISGMYYKWDTEESFDLATEAKKMSAKDVDGKTAYCAIWYDVVPGVAYSVSCVSKNPIDIQKMAEELYEPLQGDSYGDDEVMDNEPNGDIAVEGLLSISESYPDIYLQDTYYLDEIDQEEKDFGLVSAYFTDNEMLPDYDVWRFGKEGFSLEDFAAYDALLYGTGNYSIKMDKGVPTGYYVAFEEYDDEKYITETETIEENNEFVQLVSWIKTDEVELGNSGLLIYAPKGFSRVEQKEKQGNYVVYSYKNEDIDGIADFRVSEISKKSYNLISVVETYAKAFEKSDADFYFEVVDDELIGVIDGVELSDGTNDYKAVMYFIDNGDSILRVDFFTEGEAWVLDSAYAIMSTLHTA